MPRTGEVVCRRTYVNAADRRHNGVNCPPFGGAQNVSDWPIEREKEMRETETSGRKATFSCLYKRAIRENKQISCGCYLAQLWKIESKHRVSLGGNP